MCRGLAAGVWAAGALAVSGCASGTKGADVTPLGSPFGEWMLIEVEGEPVGGLLTDDARAPELRLTDDGRVAGFTGVNRFTGALDLDVLETGGFATGALAMTRMAGPAELMALEMRYVDLLNRADAHVVRGARLELLDGDDEVLAFWRKE